MASEAAELEDLLPGDWCVAIAAFAPENSFDSFLPPESDPFCLPELSEGINEQPKFQNLHEKDGAILIFADVPTKVPALSQITLRCRWGGERLPDRDYVITPNDANVFSIQLMGDTAP